MMLQNLVQIQKEQFKKTDEVTGDLIGNKIADKITKISRTLPQNNSETLQMRMIKKHLIKDIYLQKKDKKLLMI